MVTHYRMQLLLSLTQFLGGHRDVSNVLTKTILIFFVSSLAMIWEHCKEKKNDFGGVPTGALCRTLSSPITPHFSSLFFTCLHLYGKSVKVSWYPKASVHWVFNKTRP